MNAQQALTNLAEDADELERRNTVRPGYIRKRREEIAAIRAELKRTEEALVQAQKWANTVQDEAMETTERLSMFVMVLIILGMDPGIHLRRPIEDFPVYKRAVELVERKRAEAGTTSKPWRERWTWADRNTLLNGLLMEARLDLGMEYFRPYLKRMQEHAAEAKPGA
jgi:hypothetical protein